MNKTARQATFRIALSATVIALYFCLMLLSQSFAFGAYQMRFATALYALALPFPFLVVPLGLANCLSNLLGGMLWDVVGGFFVGIATAGLCALIGKLKFRLKYVLVVPVIFLIPSLVVPLWLAPILELPYAVLLVSLLVGQSAPAVLGALLIAALNKRFTALNNMFERGAQKPKTVVTVDTYVSASGDRGADALSSDLTENAASAPQCEGERKDKI